MNNEMHTTQSEREIQLRVLEYCKTLYAEENDRREKLNDAVKVYIAFLTFILGIGAFKALSAEKLLHLLNDVHLDQWVAVVAISIFSLSILSFFASLVFTILILKIWRFAMLGDPEQVVIRSHLMPSDYELLAAIIGNYVVAVNTNHKINNSKAKLLSRALFFLVLGLVLFVLSLFTVNGITVLGGL